jgi:uncharacterized protein (TIRG00374 family)
MFTLGIAFIMVLANIDLTLNLKNKILNIIISRLILLIDGMKLMIKNLRLLIRITSLDILIFIIQMLSLYFAFMAIGKTTTLFNVAFVSLVASISDIVSLTPSNLGIKEVLISFSSKAMGCTIEEGFIVAAIIRIATMIHFFTFGTIFSIVLGRGLLNHSSGESLSFLNKNEIIKSAN